MAALKPPLRLQSVPDPPVKKVITPCLSKPEREAYEAAWRVVDVMNTFNTQLWPCPSMRKSRLVDRIAEIIQEQRHE